MLSSEIKDGTAGFTLVETLVASLVMIIAVFGIFAIFPQALGSAKQSGRTSVLSQLAAEKLEQLQSLDLSSADLSNGVHPALANHSSGDKYYPVPGFSEDYSLRWTVSAGPTDGSGTAESEMRSVTVEATYFVRYDSLGTAIPGTLSREVACGTFVTD